MAHEQEQYSRELIVSAEALTLLVAENHGFGTTMDRLTKLAVEAIDGADVCSITIVRDGGAPETVGATADLAPKIDALQYETGEGPCLSSIEKTATFLANDLSQDTTWPTFSKRASEETGIGSMLSYVLRLGTDATAAMNMMSTQKEAFTEEDVDTGTLFAAQAAVVLTNALGDERNEQTIHQLENAIQTRQIIGQAIGIVMATRKVDADAAFEILKKVSQNSNTKLRAIAERVVGGTEEIT